jgi:hypothetical protein
MSQSDSARQFLRHTLATLAYRGGKALRGAPGNFADFHASAETRTPSQILAHIGDLLDWALSAARGQRKWHASTPLPWSDEMRRFFAALAAFDDYLASDSPLEAPAEKLFQAPIADALTHIGQIAMLRRLAGAPVRAEDYYVAKIAVGTVGAEQPAPVYEFT